MTTQSANLPWQPIDTCPLVDGAVYLGYDEQTAKLFGDVAMGLCLITWFDEDDDVPAGWNVQPLGENLDCVYDDETSIKFWCPLSALVPAEALS